MRRNRSMAVLTLAAVAMAALVLATSSANAELLVYEPFAYGEGWLQGLGGALGTTGTWTLYETYRNDWFVHPEGTTSDIVVTPPVDPNPAQKNTFDGTVANLPTSGGYAGAPGPADLDPPADPDADFEIVRNMDGSIGLDASVTATFQAGTTTWFSYVAVRAWDRNAEMPNLAICTDPSAAGSRAASLTNAGNGFGTGGGPPRNERTYIYPMFYKDGNVWNINGEWNKSWTNDAWGTPNDAEFSWVASDDDGFGAANIVVCKIQWDADTGGEDIFTVVRFLETDEISETAFDAAVAAYPGVSTASWDVANKPNLDQTQFDTLNIAGLKFFVDEIRIATTFDEVVGGGGEPPKIPGDANDSGFVDDDDLAILLSNWESDPGTITTWALGDFTVDTDVNDDDLAVLLGNWTGPPPPAGAAVPEPATLALLGLGGLAVLRRRRSCLRP